MEADDLRDKVAQLETSDVAKWKADSEQLEKFRTWLEGAVVDFETHKLIGEEHGKLRAYQFALNKLEELKQ